MTLSRDGYRQGKERALDRIVQWVHVVNDNGIQRLISTFPGVLQHVRAIEKKTIGGPRTMRTEKKHPKMSINVKPVPIIEHAIQKQMKTRIRRGGKPTSPIDLKYYKHDKVSSSSEYLSTRETSARRRTSQSEVSLKDSRGSRTRFSRRSSRQTSGNRQSVDDIIQSLERRGAVKSANTLQRSPDQGPGSSWKFASSAEGIDDSHITVSRSMTSSMLPRNSKSRQTSHGNSKVNDLNTLRSEFVDSSKSDVEPSPVCSGVVLQVPSPDYTYSGNTPKLVRIFRKVLIIVTLFRQISRHLQSRYDVEKKLYEVNGEDGNISVFNPGKFSRFSGALSTEARDALEKEPGTRNAEDIVSILDVINRLPVFDIYCMSVKKGLADRFVCDYVEAGRVVIKQGQIGFCSYFVVSGILCCYMSETDPKTGREFFTYLPDMMTGTSFGEVALVRKTKRTMTVVCKSDCELLVLNREELTAATRTVLRQEWDYKYAFWRSSPHFRSWPDKECRALSDLAKIRHYTDNELVLGQEDDQNIIQFILAGRCRVVKRLAPIRRMSMACPRQTGQSGTNKPHNVSVIYLKAGDYISIGKGIKNTYIVAVGTLSCIYLKLAQLKFLTMKKNLAGLEKGYLELLPDDATIRDNLITSRCWSEYKDRIVQEVISRRNIHDRARIEDVPISIRFDPAIN